MSLTTAPRLSVIVITRNEVLRLRRCLESVSFADECIVVDSGSTDGTPELAEALGARVSRTSDWPGFGAQKNRALALARGDWVLSLDADEWLDDTLAAQVRAAVEAPGAPGCSHTLSRLSSFCGQWMRHSGWSPDPVLRLFPRGAARFSDDLVHERLLCDLPTRSLPGHLLHESMPTLTVANDKMNRYSSGRAADLYARGRRGGLGSALGHGFWAFVRTYVLKRGFLDGRMGFILAVHNAETSYYRYLKMWLECNDLKR
ncbi:glycosyltransferase family 2 protein [uncultured Sphaerotilus sp.]|uniref:glycosyltransferase family 2 protein n=1 Tax=uncultured Sphaerotilus sp. TaxID=474984 RepID=UPI0030CA1E7A